VGFYKYFQPWLNKYLGADSYSACYAVLSENYLFVPQLTCFLQVVTKFQSNGIIEAKPMAGKGSGDFANLTAVDGFLELPSDQTDFMKGQSFPFIPFRPIIS
jgi:molybdopterin molybdotransferase